MNFNELSDLIISYNILTSFPFIIRGYIDLKFISI